MIYYFLIINLQIKFLKGLFEIVLLISVAVIGINLSNNCDYVLELVGVNWINAKGNQDDLVIVITDFESQIIGFLLELHQGTLSCQLTISIHQFNSQFVLQIGLSAQSTHIFLCQIQALYESLFFTIRILNKHLPLIHGLDIIHIHLSTGTSKVVLDKHWSLMIGDPGVLLISSLFALCWCTFLDPLDPA